MMNFKPILFVSGNKSKVFEINRILKSMKFNFIEHYALDLKEIQGYPIEISISKCHTAYDHLVLSKKISFETTKGILTEDVSLCFNALQGLPGPYIKYFVKNIGDDMYKLLDGFSDKTAYALCTYTYCELQDDYINSKFKTFQGKIHGEIVKSRGISKFGWDSVFKPDGSDKTFSEMTSSEKDNCSHRRKALEQFTKYINNTSLD